MVTSIAAGPSLGVHAALTSDRPAAGLEHHVTLIALVLGQCGLQAHKGSQYCRGNSLLKAFPCHAQAFARFRLVTLAVAPQSAGRHACSMQPALQGACMPRWCQVL